MVHDDRSNCQLVNEQHNDQVHERQALVLPPRETYVREDNE